jgi:hypothetical protein
MSSSFKDNENREWLLAVNVAALRRAKTAGIDLSMAVQELRRLLLDDVVTVDALWAIVGPNAKERGISLESFESGFNGTIMDTARDSLWGALANYYSPGNAQLLLAAVASVKQEMANATKQIIGNGSTNPKESLATT